MTDRVANQVDMRAFADDCVRLFVAALLGGLLGLERELHGRWAGLRTHMMVALGATSSASSSRCAAPWIL